jgi:hypothetical protein
MGKSAVKFLVAKSKALSKCWEAVSKGKGAGPCPVPGDGKAQGAIAAAAGKLAGAICKSCGGSDKTCDGSDDFAPSEIGFPDECPGVMPPDHVTCARTVGTLPQLIDCIACVSEFDAGCADRAAVPAFLSYPAQCNPGQQTIPTATPDPNATSTATALPARTATPAYTRTFTPTRTATPTPVPTATPGTSPSIDWSVPPPTKVSLGDTFPLELHVAADPARFSDVYGEVLACPNDVPVEDCFEPEAFSVMRGLCGDGFIDAPGEQCDPAVGTTGGCAAGARCTSECTCQATGPACGNGMIDGGEECDPSGVTDGCAADQFCTDDCVCRFLQGFGNAFEGRPGTFGFAATAGIDCDAPRSHYFVAAVFLSDSLTGDTLGPLFSPQAPIQFKSASGPVLEVVDDRLTFNALLGSDPPSQELSICTACGQTLTWNATPQAPWLTVTPAFGAVGAVDSCQPVMVRVATATLGVGTHQTTLRITSPSAFNSPRDVPVTVEVVAVQASWTQAPPATVAPGTSFPLALAITDGGGQFSDVSGEILACPSDTPVGDCFEPEAFSLTRGPCGDGIIDPFGEECDPAVGTTGGCATGARCTSACTCQALSPTCGSGTIGGGEECDPNALPDGCAPDQFCTPECVCRFLEDSGNAFEGRPGTFAFEATARVDCAAPRSHYFVAELFLSDPLTGDSQGPFFSPLAPVQFSAVNKPVLQAFDDRLTFTALLGTSPSAQALSICSACGEAFSWSAASQAPWLTVDPPAGNVAVDEFCQTVTVHVATATLGAGTHQTTLRLTSPLSFNSPLDVPVTIEVVAAQATWTQAPPAMVAPGTTFPLALTVSDASGEFAGVLGEVLACPIDTAVDDCFEPEAFRVTRARCGDGRIESPSEDCDPAVGTTGGCAAGARCTSACTCQVVTPACGNGTVNGGEECDPSARPEGCAAEQVCTSECVCRLLQGFGNAFSGPPATFNFAAAATVDCEAPRSHYFVAKLFLSDRLTGGSLGPLFSAQAPLQFQAATGPFLEAFDDELVFDISLGSDPPEQGLAICTACGEPFNWTASPRAPWVAVDPARGSVGANAFCENVSVDLLPATLGAGTHQTMLRITSPGALNSPLDVPIIADVAQ